MKLDVLVFAAHPDDAELGCAGTLIKLKQAGKNVGICDLTRGELGTRGTPEIRDSEAAAASKVMGLDVRENLGFRDGFFVNDEQHQLEVARMIRRYRPNVVIGNAPFDRHPDHGRGSVLVREAAFLSGLRMVETKWEGIVQEAWRPSKVFKYIQDHWLEPSFVVDITEQFEQKMDAIRAFGSQFYNPNTDEPETYISSQNFIKQVEARALQMGHLAGAKYGEGFIAERPLLVNDLTLFA